MIKEETEKHEGKEEKKEVREGWRDGGKKGCCKEPIFILSSAEHW